MRTGIALLFGLCVSFSGFAQTLSGSGGSIPDNGTTASTYNLVINGMNPSILGNDFGLKSVCVNISHNNVSDLQVSLLSPSGIEIPLFAGVGGTGNNFNGTCLSMTATNPIASGSAPYNGSYIPQGDLNNFNTMQPVNGTWKLKIRDVSAGYSGTLNSWSLTFGALPFSSSDLPILVINTNGGTIVDEPKIPVDLKIIYNGPGLRNYLNDTTYDYNGTIGIEYRGSSSQGMPKKPYGFETWDAQHNDLKVSLLGMPIESDWILLANYSDKTLMRNSLSYHLGNRMGHYSPRTRFCELVIDGSYRGVYVLTEKIKRDSGRVDVSKLLATDVSGEELTGGYIFKIDKFTGSGGAGWNSSIPPLNASGNQSIYYQYVYPKPDSIQPQQALYIKNFMDSFETALNSVNFQDEQTGWRHYMDEESVIDYMLINEMSRNVDGYRISTFLHKEKVTKGNKLKMGPIWDYDIAWLNSNYCSGQNVTGWAYDFNSVCGNDGNLVPFWWSRFRQDSLFNKRLYCRYTEFRNSFLHLDSLYALVDSMSTELNESQARNFVKWPILGTYVWPNPNPIPADYAGEITKLKGWLSDRLAWIDAQINQFQMPAPYVNLGPDTTICVGNSLFLDAGNFPIINWSTGQQDTAIYAGVADTYHVSVETKYGCHTSDTMQLDVLPLPDATFTYIQPGNFDFSFSPLETGLSYSWDFGDGTTSTDANPSHSYTLAGQYTVGLLLTDNNGCSAYYSLPVQTQTLGLAEDKLPPVSFYPNPFTTNIRLIGAGATELTLFSADGKEVLTKKIGEEDTNLDLSWLSSGLYYIQLKTEQGEYYNSKLIKQ